MKEAGHPTPETRQTRQRALIYAIVASTRTHPTADWIYERARRRMPRVSMGTVYRNLQVLEREGRLRAIDAWGKSTRYDADLSEHYHFLCDRCGAIADLEKPEGSDARVAALLRGRGYRLSGHRLEFRGICPGCRRKQAPGARSGREK